MTLYSGPTDTDLTHIPAVLKDRPQWVLWRGEDRVDETTGEVRGLNKIPIDPQTLRNADTTDPLTWGSYAQCVDALPVALEGWEHDNPDGARGGGLGFVFTADDPFCGIDLDKCRNPDTGDIDAWAKEHVESLSSYTEVTPSSTGLHILVEGSLPPHGRKKGHVEMYNQMRFFTMTGWHLPGTPLTIEPRQDALTWLHLRIFGSKKAPQPPSYAPGALPALDDATLLTRAMRAKNSAKFSALWTGDWRSYGSQSEADLALCSLLAFWSRGHAEQMDAFFRQCGLMREKWDEQRGELTYGERTIQEALARQTDYYTPRGKPRMMVGQQPQSGTPPAQTNTPAAGATAVQWGTPGQQIPPAAPDEESPQQAATALLAILPTLADDAREDAILDAMPELAGLAMVDWIRLKRQLKAAVPSVNLNDLERVRSEVRRALAAQDPASGGNAQAQLAAALATNYADTWAYDLSRQSWMEYDRGLWTPLATELVSQHIGAFMDGRLLGEYTWHDLSGVEHLLRTRLARTLSLEPPGWLPFHNGALHVETLTLYPHSPERPFTWQLPHDYDPHAPCPATRAWLHEAAGGAHDQIQVLRAYAKAVLTRRVDFQRYLEMVGPGGTGKGTYTRLLMALVGTENTFATELKQLEANRFETSNLRGKLLMVITDAERYSGPVNQLKTITGQDFVRMEGKYKDQRTEIAPVMVAIAANEPIQSADYTSGLVRRRLSLYFRHRPVAPLDLLSWTGRAWQGKLAPEIPGVLNWVLALPDAQMEALLLRTTALVSSLTETWAQALVDTNPLADWANHALIADPTRDSEGKHVATVKVGLAKKVDRSNSYEYEDIWLYPTYRAWIDATGGRALSQNRFTGLLKDLLENQLRLEGAEHTHDNQGSRFLGIRLRGSSEAEKPLLITVKPTPVKDVRAMVRAQPLGSDECEGCEGYLQNLPLGPPTHPSIVEKTGDSPSRKEGGWGVYRETFSKSASLPSRSSLERGNAVFSPHAALTSIIGVEDTEANQRIASSGAALPVVLPAVGDWITPLSLDGVIIPAPSAPPPYRIDAIEHDEHAVPFARLDVGTYWPLAQCEPAAPSAQEGKEGTPVREEFDV